MNNRKVYTSKLILMYCLLGGVLLSQPKLNIQLGGGYYNPKLIGLDPDSNNVIPSGSLLSNNLLLNWGVRYQIYHNMRLGYTQSHSLHFGKIGSSKYSRNIAFRSISFETFYYVREKMELNFTLAPMINKGRISIIDEKASADMDTLLSSYNNSSVNLSTGGTMKKTWLGFASHVGLRYYFSSLLSVEGKIGYYNSSYSENNWKLEGEKVTGPKMKIKELPIIQFNLIIGL
tara:strand:- start:1252 stop:1944 length:693 start_codon:yes stop_codon:yes gene_type:complete